MSQEQMVSLSLRVVQPSDADVFNLQFSARADAGGQVVAIAVTTDGPIENEEGSNALADVIEFTEGLLEALREAKEALDDGKAENYTDTRFHN